jgi:hypothetical protein
MPKKCQEFKFIQTIFIFLPFIFYRILIEYFISAADVHPLKCNRPKSHLYKGEREVINIFSIHKLTMHISSTLIACQKYKGAFSPIGFAIIDR